jgi:hypothetical protein
MSKRGQSGTRHTRAGGGARARGRRGFPTKFHQGKPNRFFHRK